MATINVLDAVGTSTAVEKPNANGRQAAAGSRPVALSTEDVASLTQLHTDMIAATPAGTNVIGKVGIDPTANVVDTTASTYAKVIPSNTITRPANTTAYAAGQIVGVTGGGATGRFAFTSAARVNGGPVRIDRLRLYKSQASATGTFQLWVYRGDPATTGAADQATTISQLSVGTASGALRLVGRVNFDMTGAALGSDGAECAGTVIIGPAILAAAGSTETSLYGVLVATGAYTPLSGETFSIVMEGYSF